MDSLLYFLFWGVVLFLMMRFGCGAHVMGHGHNHSGRDRAGGQARWIPPESDLDPVCDKVVRPAEALSSVYDGHVYYFCGARCREKFEASPDRYLQGSNTPPGAAKEVHNV